MVFRGFACRWMSCRLRGLCGLFKCDATGLRWVFRFGDLLRVQFVGLLFCGFRWLVAFRFGVVAYYGLRFLACFTCFERWTFTTGRVGFCGVFY